MGFSGAMIEGFPHFSTLSAHLRVCHQLVLKTKCVIDSSGIVCRGTRKVVVCIVDWWKFQSFPEAWVFDEQCFVDLIIPFDLE